MTALNRTGEVKEKQKGEREKVPEREREKERKRERERERERDKLNRISCREALPGHWDTDLDSFQKLLVLKCIRADKVTNAMQVGETQCTVVLRSFYTVATCNTLYTHVIMPSVYRSQS